MDELKQIFYGTLAAVNQGHPLALLVMVGITAITELGIPTMGIIDAILLYIGYQYGLFSLRALLIILLLTAGRVIGSSILFWPARQYGYSFINWFERRFSKISLKINTVSSQLKVNQVQAVIILRFTPGLLTASSIALGMLRIRYKNFLSGVVVHACIADVVLILLGQLGKNSVSLAGITPETWQVVSVAFIIVLLISIVILVIQRRSSKKSSFKKRQTN